MLSELRLLNFRRFEDHVVPLRKHTVIVGPNNAGKSTVVEALRLISLVANRFRNLQYSAVPGWLDEPVGMRGVTPSLRDLNTDLEFVFHAYSDPPAAVEARFANKSSIKVYVGPQQTVFAVVRDPKGKVITSKAQAARAEIPGISIQPQVAPLQMDERLLDVRTVRRGMDSPLAPLHFRNQLQLLRRDHFDDFVSLAEQTWPTLEVEELTGGTPATDLRLSLLLRDDNFVGEVGLMGHGLQMWLQVVWFLARNPRSPTLVLDEPDVYLHANLQRKLIRILRGFDRQVIVATHSIEIMSEVEPSSILNITANRTRSRWVTDLKGAQRVVDQIGGVHNIQLARLAHARRALFVEGDGDAEIMKAIADTLHPDAESFDSIPRLTVAGWGGWERIVGAAEFLRNASGDAIDTYAIFDSDYHDPNEILDRYQRAEQIGVGLHVWRRKEIENYLLVPGCLQRIMDRKSRRRSDVPSVDDVEDALEQIASGLLQDAIDDAATQHQRLHRGKAPASLNKWARAYIDVRTSEVDGLLSVIPGKRAVRELSAWASGVCDVTFGAGAVARELRTEEIDPEMNAVIASIELGRVTPPDDIWSSRRP